MDLQEIRQLLIDKKQDTEQFLQENNNDSKPVTLDQQSIGRLSRMDAIQQQQMSLEVKNRRKNDLVKINQALKLIEQGEYGYCLICSDEINEQRIMANPTNLTCINCTK